MGDLEHFIPAVRAPNGRRPTNLRLVRDGIFWIVGTGAPWRAPPDGRNARWRMGKQGWLGTHTLRYLAQRTGWCRRTAARLVPHAAQSLFTRTEGVRTAPPLDAHVSLTATRFQASFHRASIAPPCPARPAHGSTATPQRSRIDRIMVSCRNTSRNTRLTWRSEMPSTLARSAVVVMSPRSSLRRLSRGRPSARGRRASGVVATPRRALMEIRLGDVAGSRFSRASAGPAAPGPRRWSQRGARIFR